jgi:hypothetical protein
VAASGHVVFLFRNQVVEKALGVPATTRWWETFERTAPLVEAD